MIIIDTVLETSSLKARVARQMLQIIHTWNADAEFVTLTNSEQLIEQISSKGSKIVISTFQLPLNVSVILNGLGIVPVSYTHLTLPTKRIV